MNYQTRRELLRRIEEARRSKAILYVTGDRPGQETYIQADSLNHFPQHLDAIGKVERISFILYTTGGDPMVAWTICNQLRMYCDYLEVIVPAKCFSAGTLLCLGANEVIMTKRSLLGPIDPTVFAPLGPRLPVEHAGPSQLPVGVSVEDINAYMEQARESLPNQPLHAAFDRLTEAVNPLVIGSAFRARRQIRMLGRRLLSKRFNDEAKVENILDFLCSDSGSHDYTINRREAAEDLGLQVAKPDRDLDQDISAIHQSFVDEMELLKPFDPQETRGTQTQVRYTSNRSMIESVQLGSHRLQSNYTFLRRQTELQPGIVNETTDIDARPNSWKLLHASDD